MEERKESTIEREKIILIMGSYQYKKRVNSLSKKKIKAHGKIIQEYNQGSWVYDIIKPYISPGDTHYIILR